ncbi:MAG: DUF4855 domain-containing protein [Promethearchaeia archaeon]
MKFSKRNKKVLIISICLFLIPPYLFMFWHFSRLPSYLKPGDSTGNIHNMILIYCGKSRDWSQERYFPYVSYLDKNLKPQDSFFDGFLFLAITSSSDRLFIEKVSEKECAVKSDWDWFINKLMKQDGCIKNLSSSFTNISLTLNKTLNGKVVIMIPYPDRSVSKFGKIDGKNLNFDYDDDRLTAVKWFISETISKWNSQDFSNLELVGFYWMRESIIGSDVDLIKSINEYIHSKELKSFWIPYHFASGVSSWKELGFDCVAYQPNYFFYFWAHESRIHVTALKASLYGTGVELEIDDNIFSNKDTYYPRYIAYLEAAEQDGFSNGFMAYYQSVDTLKKLSESSDRDLRELYDKTYEISRNNL